MISNVRILPSTEVGRRVNCLDVELIAVGLVLVVFSLRQEGWYIGGGRLYVFVLLYVSYNLS